MRSSWRFCRSSAVIVCPMPAPQKDSRWHTRPRLSVDRDMDAGTRQTACRKRGGVSGDRAIFLSGCFAPTWRNRQGQHAASRRPEFRAATTPLPTRYVRPDFRIDSPVEQPSSPLQEQKQFRNPNSFPGIRSRQPLDDNSAASCMMTAFSPGSVRLAHTEGMTEGVRVSR